MSATFQQVQMNYWRDTTDDEFSREEKYLYLYLMTNESVTSCGVYKISKITIIHETSMSEHLISSAMASLQDREKIFYDSDTREIILLNHINYESNSPMFQANVAKVLARVKSLKILEMRKTLEEGRAVELPKAEQKEEGKKVPAPKKPEKNAYGTHKNVFLTARDIEMLIEKFGKKGAQEGVDILSSYKEAHGKTYKNDYAAFHSWVKGELEKKGIYEKRPDGKPVNGQPEAIKCPACGYQPTGASSSGSCDKCGLDRKDYTDKEKVATYREELIESGLGERLGLTNADE